MIKFNPEMRRSNADITIWYTNNQPKTNPNAKHLLWNDIKSKKESNYVFKKKRKTAWTVISKKKEPQTSPHHNENKSENGYHSKGSFFTSPRLVLGVGAASILLDPGVPRLR